MIKIDVTIMGQAYKLSCKSGEEAALQEAVNFLDSRMCTIRDSGKVKGNDRIAVMAALGVAAELLSTKSPSGPLADISISAITKKIADMHAVLDTALTPQEKLF